ncbi:PSEA-binding protein 49kD [Carabus blaptoides fortunei]
MEEIYKPQHFNATDHINFKEYFEQYSSLVFDFQNVRKPVTDDEIFAKLNSDLNAEQKKMLIDACSIDHLSVKGEKEPADAKRLHLFQPFDITEDAEKLETVKQFKKRREERRKEFLYDPRLPEIDRRVKPILEVPSDADLIPGEDFIVYVRLFRPFHHTYGETNKESLKFDQEIALLGTNTLAEFRSKIACTTDMTDYTDKSDDIESIEAFELDPVPYPSGFIFIDDIFYNDFRDSNALDYSDVIRKWAEGKGIGPFQVAEMKDTQIQDLKPRMSYPYVYQHHGRCEHVFIFSHARLLHHGDKLQSDAYPFYSNACYYKNVNCMICGQLPAAWLVTDYDRLSKDEAPLCKTCLLSYCYVDGKKIGKFGVYPYMNRTTAIV